MNFDLEEATQIAAELIQVEDFNVAAIPIHYIFAHYQEILRLAKTLPDHVLHSTAWLRYATAVSALSTGFKTIEEGKKWLRQASSLANYSTLFQEPIYKAQANFWAWLTQEEAMINAQDDEDIAQKYKRMRLVQESRLDWDQEKEQIKNMLAEQEKKWVQEKEKMKWEWDQEKEKMKLMWAQEKIALQRGKKRAREEVEDPIQADDRGIQPAMEEEHEPEEIPRENDEIEREVDDMDEENEGTQELEEVTPVNTKWMEQAQKVRQESEANALCARIIQRRNERTKDDMYLYEDEEEVEVCDMEDYEVMQHSQGGRLTEVPNPFPMFRLAMIADLRKDAIDAYNEEEDVSALGEEDYERIPRPDLEEQHEHEVDVVLEAENILEDDKTIQREVEEKRECEEDAALEEENRLEGNEMQQVLEKKQECEEDDALEEDMQEDYKMQQELEEKREREVDEAIEKAIREDDQAIQRELEEEREREVDEAIEIAVREEGEAIAIQCEWIQPELGEEKEKIQTELEEKQEREEHAAIEEDDEMIPMISPDLEEKQEREEDAALEEEKDYEMQHESHEKQEREEGAALEFIREAEGLRHQEETYEKGYEEEEQQEEPPVEQELVNEQRPWWSRLVQGK